MDTGSRSNPETVIGHYVNGNYKVIILTDGTKIRMAPEDTFVPDFAENIDIKICDWCDGGCRWCHEASTTFGGFGNLSHPLFDTLHPYQEIAIGGGNALAHPDLIPFLERMKGRRVVCNLTVNQVHFGKQQDIIKDLVERKLIYGLGISLVDPTDDFLEMVGRYPNAVIHVINGLVTKDIIQRMYDRNIKLLVLGYKKFGRGADYYSMNHEFIDGNIAWLRDNVKDVMERVRVMSFDNLALDQLDMKSVLTPEQWESFYMGDDGTSTFYIDLVEERFAKNSTTSHLDRLPLEDSVDTMFRKIKNATK